MLSSTRAMTCSNLWCSWVRRAVGFDSSAFTTWKKKKKERKQQRWLLAAAERSCIHQSSRRRKSATCLDTEGSSQRKGEPRQNNRSASASSAARTHASTPQRLFTYLQNPHLLCYSCPIVVTRVSVDLWALSGSVLPGRASWAGARE